MYMYMYLYMYICIRIYIIHICAPIYRHTFRLACPAARSRQPLVFSNSTCSSGRWREGGLAGVWFFTASSLHMMSFLYVLCMCGLVVNWGILGHVSFKTIAQRCKKLQLRFRLLPTGLQSPKWLGFFAKGGAE